LSLSTYTATGLFLALDRRSETLPDNLRDPDVSIDNFKCLLETFLLSAYHCN